MRVEPEKRVVIVKHKSQTNTSETVHGGSTQLYGLLGKDPCMLNEWVGTVKFVIENNIKQLETTLNSSKHKTRKRQVSKGTRCRTAPLCRRLVTCR